MAENKRYISLREGGMYLDGSSVAELVSAKVTIKPDISQNRAIGEKTKSTKWLGYDIAVEITEFKSTPWMKAAIKEYLKSGKTPEFTVQGIQKDKNSDYYDEFGGDSVTVKGCVITSDISLLELDTDGQTLKQSVTLAGKKISVK